MLRPRLQALKDGGILLGIISKSTEFTIRSALQAAGLSDFFQGPIVAKAVGLEGKAGFIEELVTCGSLQQFEDKDPEESLQRVLLVDDDVLELDRAKEIGVQTFPAPEEGGLQDEDFDEMFVCLGLYTPATPREVVSCIRSQCPIDARPSVTAAYSASPSHGGA